MLKILTRTSCAYVHMAAIYQTWCFLPAANLLICLQLSNCIFASQFKLLEKLYIVLLLDLDIKLEISTPEVKFKLHVTVTVNN